MAAPGLMEDQFTPIICTLVTKNAIRTWLPFFELIIFHQHVLVLERLVSRWELQVNATYPYWVIPVLIVQLHLSCCALAVPVSKLFHVPHDPDFLSIVGLMMECEGDGGAASHLAETFPENMVYEGHSKQHSQCVYPVLW